MKFSTYVHESIFRSKNSLQSSGGFTRKPSGQPFWIVDFSYLNHLLMLMAI
jgi:hypothetical protein